MSDRQGYRRRGEGRMKDAGMITMASRFTDGKISQELRDITDDTYKDLRRPKRVRFYKNGDRYFHGRKFRITPHRYLTFGELLQDLNKVVNLPYGVRRIYTPVSGTQITSVDELKDGQSYVCASFERFQRIKYGSEEYRVDWNAGYGAKAKNPLQDPSHWSTGKYSLHNDYNPRATYPPSTGGRSSFGRAPQSGSGTFGPPKRTNSHTVHSDNSPLKPKVITVVRNGDRPRTKITILLNRRSVQTFEQLIADISEALGQPRWKNNHVKKLYNLKGREVKGIGDFFREDDMFIATGREQITTSDVQDILEEVFPDSPYAQNLVRKSQGKQKARRQNHDFRHDPGLLEVERERRERISRVEKERELARQMERERERAKEDEREKARRWEEERRRKEQKALGENVKRRDNGRKKGHDEEHRLADYRLLMDEKEREWQREIEERERLWREEERRWREMMEEREQMWREEDEHRRRRWREEDIERERRIREEEIERERRKWQDELERERRKRVEEERQLEIMRDEERLQQEKERERVRKQWEEEDRQKERERQEERRRWAEEDNRPGGGRWKPERQRQQNGHNWSDDEDLSRLQDSLERRGNFPNGPRAKSSKDQQGNKKSKSRAFTMGDDTKGYRPKTWLSKHKVDPRKQVTEKEMKSRYEIGKTIGDGNFAVVKEAKLKNTDSDYALKIIDKSKLRGKEDMVENEIAIMKHCQHENIVQLFEEYESEHDIYLVMEYVKGGDLFDAITESVKFTERDAASMVKDLVSALAFLHSKNIVHRDLKPENLLVQKNRDGRATLKLADFGLAMEVIEPIFTVCGTPTYVAPEILGEEGYGLEVDMWATGVITYILLCGFPPFRSLERDQEELFQIIQTGEYEFLSPYWDNISDSAKDLINHLLVVEPQQRYTAQQVLGHPWIRSEGNFKTVPNLQREITLNLEKNFKHRPRNGHI
ncbi:serine/threonine-protein kinase DCLK3-like isoform X1 [Branchiostoma lanceolatum]|uniref:serine/threonine-protein kinase DCLK3-like isoform X1 n=2 Tax=Branchiostoma lanceolatum TaxID=7740 RepID=UPI003451C776